MKQGQAGVRHGPRRALRGQAPNPVRCRSVRVDDRPACDRRFPSAHGQSRRFGPDSCSTSAQSTP